MEKKILEYSPLNNRGSSFLTGTKYYSSVSSSQITVPSGSNNPSKIMSAMSTSEISIGLNGVRKLDDYLNYKS
ncbi:MAG: hypothetical protein AB8H03_15010 [Saprospiraceae bacterium]